MADITVQKIGGDVPALALNQAGTGPISKFAGLSVGNGIVTGMTGSVAANAGGDAFLNDGRTYFEVLNGVTAAIDVTFVRQRTSGSGEKYNAVYNVPVSTTKLCGPFPAGDFNDPTTGKVSVTYSAVTNVNVRAFKMSEKLNA